MQNKEITVGHIYYFQDKDKLIVNFPTNGILNIRLKLNG